MPVETTPEHNAVFAKNAKSTTRWERKRGHILKKSGKKPYESIILESVDVVWGKSWACQKQTSTIGLKKTAKNEQTGNFQQVSNNCYELDELYWFIEKKAKSETRENIYLMTMINPEPRQIVGFEVVMDKGAAHIQNIVDNAPWAKKYATDGYLGYCDVIFPGEHIRNVHNKKNTHNVESINADLRHYIPVLQRRSRCFCRKLETLQIVIEVFVDAYNQFGEAKLKYRKPTRHKDGTAGKHLHKFREPAFSILDFL